MLTRSEPASGGSQGEESTSASGKWKHLKAMPASGSITTAASGGITTPASGGVIEDELICRLKDVYMPLGQVEMQTPSSVPAASYVKGPDAVTVYMQPINKGDTLGCAASIKWLPQEAADWLYQTTHYAIPLLQTLLGTHKAFDCKGHYLDADKRPASGGQLVAFWGTELGSRRDRGLIAYDNDVDFEAFITPCCDFDLVWQLAAPVLEKLDLSCRITIPGKYYRICPKTPLTFNLWREWCHESRQPGLSRAQVMSAAGVRTNKGDAPAQPRSTLDPCGQGVVRLVMHSICNSACVVPCECPRYVRVFAPVAAKA